MKKILFISHGKMASGVSSTLNILIGQNDDFTVFDAYVNDHNVSDFLDEYIANLDDEYQLILMSDIYGGSVNTLMMQKLLRPNTYLLSGVNLPIILEVLLHPGTFEKVELEDILQGARDAMKIVEIDPVIEEDENFF